MVCRFLLLKKHFLEMYCTEIHKQPLKMDFDEVFTEQRPLLLRYFKNFKCYDVNKVESKIWKNQPPNQPPCGQLNRKGQKEDSYAQCLVRFLITTFINYLKGFSVNWKLYRPIINKATPRLFEWTSFLLLPFHDHYAWWSYVIIVFHLFCKIISFQTTAFWF